MEGGSPVNIYMVGPDDIDQNYEAWLEPGPPMRFNGLCIGAGHTREAALIDAQRELVHTVRYLSELIWQCRQVA